MLGRLIMSIFTWILIAVLFVFAVKGCVDDGKMDEDVVELIETTQEIAFECLDDLDVCYNENKHVNRLANYYNQTSEYWKYKAEQPKPNIRFDSAFTGCERQSADYVFCKDCDYTLFCTPSMNPIFNCNSKITFCDAKGEDIGLNDIILFTTPEYQLVDIEERYLDGVNIEDYAEERYYIIHQVVDITKEGYRTKGLNNGYVDDYTVPFNKVTGKLWKVEAN